MQPYQADFWEHTQFKQEKKFSSIIKHGCYGGAMVMWPDSHVTCITK